jgi:hypothetical protein
MSVSAVKRKREKRMAQVFKRDDDGNVVDPPINPELERELTRARDSGDTDYVSRVQQEYDDWRSSEVERIEGAGDTPVATDDTQAGPAVGSEGNVTPGAPGEAALDPAQQPAPGNGGQ